VGVDQKGGKKLLVFEKKVLRTICDPKIGNGVYRRRYNHELDKEFDLCPNALNVTKTNRLRYADYMIKRPEDLPQKAIFRAKPNTVKTGVSFRHSLRHRNSASASVVLTLKCVCLSGKTTLISVKTTLLSVKTVQVGGCGEQQ
jgi:hypothetical protein